MSLFKKDPSAKKPSFSNVSSGSSSAPARPEPKAPSASQSAGRPDFSNVQHGGSSTAPTREASERTTYVVRSGDSLSRIALHHYGDAALWPRIYEANLETIGKNPDHIRPGQELVLPPKSEA